MPWKESSDGKSKDKVDVDLEKGRVTHERITKSGESHDHEWIDTRSDSMKSGYRGENSGKKDDADTDENSEE